MTLDARTCTTSLLDTLPRCRWHLPPADPLAGDLARALDIPALLGQLLVNRGIADVEAGRQFLQPSLRHLHDPACIPNVEQAAERLAEAVRRREKVVVFGDYDVDGITAAGILWHALTLLGGDVRCYVPHRVEEGYGLNTPAIEQLCDEGAQLIVTVDCGITAIGPAAAAKARGVDLIVTDHHEFATPEAGDNTAGPHLPDCFAVVHPRLAGDCPNPHLCGAGVAFKLAWELGRAMAGGGKVSEAFRAFLVEATALAALGTIADVVPLVGENRTIARYGLGGLKESTLRGVRALIASAGLETKRLDSYHVGFLLAPRLNAAGRMGHAKLAVEMFTTADEPRAEEIATYLEEQNRDRQATERQIVAEAVKQVELTGLDDPSHHAIVVAGDGWHVGVVGIVASRLVDRFHKPAVVIGMNQDGTGAGSARSIPGFDLASALACCTEHLASHGGHEMAAGLKVRRANLMAFQEAFSAVAAERLEAHQLVPTLRADAEAGLDDVTEPLVTAIDRLGPFGNANPKPLLVVRGVKLTAPARSCGKTNDHLQLRIKQGRTFMKCIAFGLGNLARHLNTGDELDLAVRPQINEWNGTRSVELEVVDLAVVDGSCR
ncbi:MAG: single-stranded-DNA-specific exonuclease RecJ [Phycisphaerae bacterium]